MPVKAIEAQFPKPDVQFEQPEGPETVEFDAGDGDSTGFNEVETGDDTVTADWHRQESTDLVPQGEGETVTLDWLTNAQAKVVDKPKSGSTSKTSGAKTK